MNGSKQEALALENGERLIRIAHFIKTDRLRGDVERLWRDFGDFVEAACIHSISWQKSHRAFCDEAFILKHDTDHQAEYIRNKIANGSKFYMLCDKQSMAVVSITDGLIEDLYVMPELQRQGDGTALLDYVITLICREGITPTLWILENNREAERLYRRKGVVPSGKQNAITGKLSEIEFLYKGI